MHVQITTLLHRVGEEVDPEGTAGGPPPPRKPFRGRKARREANEEATAARLAGIAPPAKRGKAKDKGKGKDQGRGKSKGKAQGARKADPAQSAEGKRRSKDKYDPRDKAIRKMKVKARKGARARAAALKANVRASAL